VPDPKNNINNAVAFAEKWYGAYPTITPSIFCHSPYTCSVETLQNAKNAAASKGLLFQIHAAETQNERNRILSEHKATPIELLDRLGILDQKTLLVHAVWVDDKDIEIIGRNRVGISHNPESNMKLASGIAPVPQFLQSNLTVGLGTDGCASNNHLDLFREMDVTAKLHKVNAHDPTLMDAQTVLKMATIEGAKAIGLDKAVGSLEPGKQADLIIIDIQKPHLVPMYNPVSHIVYAVSGSDVRDVIIAGKIIVRRQELLTLNAKEILERVAAMSKLIRKNTVETGS
jgi:5-methylthioadenosine/S-adenosylhomocysteine deaminase